MKVEIKRAVESEAKMLALLGQVTFREAFGKYFLKQDLQDYFAESFSVEKISKELRGKNNIFWLALAEELPVGYAKFKKPSELEKLYILQEFEGNRIGEMLQNEVIAEVKKTGTQELFLTVRTDNAKAIRFYEKHGFVRAANRIYTVGREKVECLIMVKKL